MTSIELMSDQLIRLHGLLTMTLADFSDADMLVRPCPGANHAAWQLGHLITSTVGMAASVPGFQSPTLPAGWTDKFKKATAILDDPKAFATKAELLATFSQVNDALLAATKKLKESDLSLPSPEQMKDFAPTIGHIVGMTGSHYMMHVGQFQVIRRKLNKPLLF